MARSEANETFASSSFLYGGNADYIDELFAQYRKDPSSVSNDWQEFFATFEDADDIVAKNASGASWERPNWPHNSPT